MSLTPVDDLREYMDRKDFTSRQESSAQRILNGLEAQLKRLLKRPIEVTVFSEDFRIDGLYNTIPVTSEFQNNALDMSSYPYVTSELTSLGAPYIAVQQPYLLELESPVISVTSVVVNGTLATVDSDYVVRKFGIDLYAVSANDLIHVDYTAGWDWAEYPDLQLLLLRAAAREMTLMVDDVYGVKDLETFSRHLVIPVPGFNQAELNYIGKIARTRPA